MAIRKRYKLNKGASRRIFSRGARSNRRNRRVVPLRGGYRI